MKMFQKNIEILYFLITLDSKHLRGNNEIIYRVFVSDPYELKFVLHYFPNHPPFEDCQLADSHELETTLNRKLFHMILQNSDFPFDISQDDLTLNFRSGDWYKRFPNKRQPIQLPKTYEISWKIDKIYFNVSDEFREQDFVELPSFSNINDTKIYFFDLFYNEFANVICNFEVILPTDYLVGIIIYEAKDIPIFEEYSSLFLAFLIAFIVILILLCFGICGGGIYLGYYTKYNNMKEFKTSESNQPESSFGNNENEGEKIESKSDSNEMVNDEHLVECDCIECNEDQKDKEKLIRSIIPDVQKLISDCINDGIDQKYLVPESQAAFTKLIKKEMKRRNLKPKKVRLWVTVVIVLNG
uniref:Uncharacterized protein n=1 Tax=Panagrolaimus sp. ES5 TaxID=591445 RepID=A0AC34GTZ0_9BILA